jgi:tryptophan-rich sensory protein
MNKWLALLGFLAMAFAAAATGIRYNPGAWYDALNKPAWTPPPILFPIVWTVLYVAMAVAAWLVWRQGGWSEQTTPLTLFVIQLLFNALWSWLFFGRHEIGWAMFDLALLWIAVAATTLAFWKVSPVAGGLFVPYLIWASFAGALNFWIWRQNP